MKPSGFFLEPAEIELFEAIAYYNEQSSGLGYDLALEVEKAIQRIITFPESWTKLSERTRKCRCNRFPYSIIYSIHDSSIIILAIMHSKREPNYWSQRVI